MTDVSCDYIGPLTGLRCANPNAGHEHHFTSTSAGLPKVSTEPYDDSEVQP